jgi:Mn-dependent DtxR family transcriptional regulator
MSIDIEVLQAMLRLARRRAEVSEGELALRVHAEAPEIRASIRRLHALGLVDSRGRAAARLTLEGLALSVALARPAAQSGARQSVGRSRAA